MKSNEDNKTWISNILVRNIFFWLKPVYCCLTFVCVYMYFVFLEYYISFMICWNNNYSWKLFHYQSVINTRHNVVLPIAHGIKAKIKKMPIKERMVNLWIYVRSIYLKTGVSTEESMRDEWKLGISEEQLVYCNTQSGSLNVTWYRSLIRDNIVNMSRFFFHFDSWNHSL